MHSGEGICAQGSRGEITTASRATATRGNLVRRTTGSQGKVLGKGVTRSDFHFQIIGRITFHNHNVRVSPLSQKGERLLTKEVPTCSGLS